MVERYTDMFTSQEYPKHLVIHNSDHGKGKTRPPPFNYSIYARIQLEYLLSMLKLIRLAVDLGYNDFQTNLRIFKVLPNIFYGMVLQT
jgi:hypothetical protein